MFWFGLLCGIGAALAMRGVLLAALSRPGVEKPGALPSANTPAGWEQTRNFLYYDGTVMPTTKEDIHE